jgi:ABC-2 type transport system permease protein
MMTLYLPVILLTFLVWLFLQNFQISGDESLRIFLLFLFYFVFIGIFSVIAVLVSAMSKTSKIALTSLIGIWLLLTIVLPKASQALGAYLYETPSKAKFQAQIEADVIKTGDSHNADDPHYKALKDSVLMAYKVDSVQQLPFNYSGFQMREGERISAYLYNVHLEKLRNIYEKQNQFSKTLAILNPFLAIKNLSMALAGTDYYSLLNFQDQAEAYRYHISQEMNELQVNKISNSAKTSAGKKNILSKNEWAAVDDFDYVKPNISNVFKHESLSIISLIGWLSMLYLLIINLSKTFKAI